MSEDVFQKFLDNDSFEWEEVTLPSKGLYYGDKAWSPVGIPNGTVKVRPWTTEEEKILNTVRYLKNGTAISKIFAKACKFPEGFDPRHLLIGDQTFLLFYFRGISYGNLYEFTQTCTNDTCGVKSSHTYDLNNLANEIVWADESVKEPTRIHLPAASKAAGGDIHVWVRFTRVADSASIDTELKSTSRNLKKKDGPDERTTIQLAYNIVMVEADGTQYKERSVISKLVSKLTVMDASIIRDWLNKNTPGIVPKAKIECPACSNEMETELPIGENFFRFTGTGADRESVA